jgi:hypothetical protein
MKKQLLLFGTIFSYKTKLEGGPTLEEMIPLSDLRIRFVIDLKAIFN